ncbi:hypothetical protein MMC13_005849 [Lambiella insularis]|nr:hypothetical protein [Lambiella insularis]
MASGQYIPPDLASILRTLAASTPSTQSNASSFDQTNSIAPLIPQEDNFEDPKLALDLDLDLEEGEYDPNDAILSSSGRELGAAQGTARPITPPPSSLSLLASASQRVPKPPLTDPRAITSFGTALRHITHVISRNEATMSRIRKLIQSQHLHERQWWEAREALVKKQAGREEGRRKVDEVLRSMGGKVSAPVTGPTPEDDIAELSVYDRKVYKACLDMVIATKAELQALGIPFFGIRPELVVSDAVDETEERKSGGPTKLTQQEVIDLQKRVLGLLEDLCQE